MKSATTISLLAVFAVLTAFLDVGVATAADQAAGGNPLETAKQAPKGSLKSPYPDVAKVAEEGHQKYWPPVATGVTAVGVVAAWVRP